VPVEDILVHRATPIREVEQGDWIEGERDAEPQPLDPFPCCLFLPLGQEQQQGGRSRKVTAPTLLYQPGPAANVLTADDEVLVRAPELAAWTDGQAEVKWKVDGAPQPAGRPGEEPVVVQAKLVRVRD
jgi:hypothetical protein